MPFGVGPGHGIDSVITVSRRRIIDFVLRVRRTEGAPEMPRFRITVINTPDRADQLRRANRIRETLVDHVRVRLDPVYPLQGIHRDEQGRAYFEFAAEDLQPVRIALAQAGHEDHSELMQPVEAPGDACANCGNIAGPILPSVCPNCGFRDISPCPICRCENPRESYERIAGNLFLCPTPLHDGTRHRVRLSFNEPMFGQDGDYRQPLVIVREATRPWAATRP
jgi:hypothetical protein